MAHDAFIQLLHWLAHVFGLIKSLLFLPASFLSVWVLGATLALSALWYRYGGKRVRSWRVLRRALFRRHHFTGRSARADQLMTVLNHLVFTTGFVAALLGLGALAATIRHGLAELTGVSQMFAIAPWAAQAITTVFAFLAYEFAYYTNHRMMHQVPFLWHFHKVHHTAETLSPLVNFRVHPVDAYIFTAFNVAAAGAMLGLCRWLFGAAAVPATVNGVNLVLVVAIYLFVSLQHTQVWMPFTGRLGRTLLSPAHHQLHHSIDPRHYHSNYGSVLALADRLFGTLRVPTKASPQLRFGVNDLTDDPHSVTGLLIVPCRDAWRELVPGGAMIAPSAAKQTV